LKLTSTPLPEKIILGPATDAEVNATCNFLYLKVIGSMMYAMTGTCPDIAYAVAALS
jgi:hypothetical protein